LLDSASFHHENSVATTAITYKRLLMFIFNNVYRYQIALYGYDRQQ